MNFHEFSSEQNYLKYLTNGETNSSSKIILEMLRKTWRYFFYFFFLTIGFFKQIYNLYYILILLRKMYCGNFWFWVNVFLQNKNRGKRKNFFKTRYARQLESSKQRVMILRHFYPFSLIQSQWKNRLPAHWLRDTPGR